MASMSLQARLDKCENPLLAKLFRIMIEKKTNLCVAADFMDFERIMRLVEKVGKHICILKTHLSQTDKLENKLQALYEAKKRFNFLLFEDCKYFDGHSTVRLLYEACIVKYVDIVTVAPEFGDDIYKAIEEGARNTRLPSDEPRGCFSVCELSFANMARLDNSKRWLEDARKNSSVCIGIISQKLQVTDRNNMVKATPGVNIGTGSDGLNQQWRTPQEVIKDGTDILIVGRGITSNPENQWESLALKYNTFIL